MIPVYLAPLADHLWQSTLFAAAVGVLVLALQQNRAAVRYRLWLAASIKFLLPFSLLVSLGGHFQWRQAAPVAPSRMSFAATEIGEPFAASMAVPVIANPVPTQDRTPEILLGLWLRGVLVCLVPLISQWRYIRNRLRNAVPLRLDLPLSIRVMSCPGNMEPGVFGVFGPVLLLPEGIADRLTDSELNAVLAHELCHVRRRDNLWAAVHIVVETLFWFHPLVWWIEKRMIDEQENACDEEVLRLGSDPQAYAEGILKVCRLYLASPLACVAKVTGSDLLKRVEAIMKDGAALKLNFGKKFLLATAGIVAVASPIVVGLMNVPQTRAQSPAVEGRSTAFEVVSIKPCDDPRQHQVPGGMYPPRGNSSPGRLSTECFPLLDNNGMGLIRSAYVPSAEGFTPIVGGPSWVQSAFYEINATAEGTPSVATMRGPMMQVLLEDRFKLKIHRQTSEGPVYFLTVAREGPKLHAFAEGSCTPRSSPPPPPLQPGQKYCEGVIHTIPPAAVEDQGTTLDDFSKQLFLVLDRPVINKTGITGRFDIRVEFSREGTKLAAIPLMLANGGNSPDSDPTGPPSISTALEEQLGLKLESGKGPIDTLVIDRIERPKENEASNRFETSSTVSSVLARPVAKTVSFSQGSPSTVTQTLSDAEARYLGLASDHPERFQSPAPPPPSFKTATVEPNHSGALSQTGPAGCHGSEMKTSPVPLGQCAATNLTLKNLVEMAFGLRFPQVQVISKGPQWIENDRYDIDVKVSDADPDVTTDQLYLMVRGLLMDRFKLQIHNERRDVAAYALVAAENGPKLKKADDGEPMFYGNLVEGPGVIGRDVPIGILGILLGNNLGIPVLNRTQIEGNYDFSLSWNSLPSLASSLQEKLGLKLQSVKVPLDVLVIDGAEKPN